MSEKLTCQECVQQLSAEDKFCSNCGFKIIADQKKLWKAFHTLSMMKLAKSWQKRPRVRIDNCLKSIILRRPN